MTKAGNWSKVPLLQAQLLESDTATQVARAEAQNFSAQEKLIKRLGLWGEQVRIQLPQQLPDLPGAPLPWTDLETQALQHKPALTQARSNADYARAQVNAKDLLVLQQTVHNAAAQWPGAAGKTLALNHLSLNPPTLPSRLAMPNPALEKALVAQTRLETLLIDSQSQTREAWFRYRNAFDVARQQRDVLVPLTTALQEETQLRYNGMLQSTWELLASARARLESANAAVMAQRDFWLAHTDLQAVLAGGDVEFPNNASQTGPASSTSPGH
jgi:outer membrane protein TolC